MKKYRLLPFIGIFLLGVVWSTPVLAGSDSASVPDQRIPWSGYWWPRSSGKLVKGYSEQPAPLKKYDALVVGYYPDHATSAGMNVEYDPDAASWYGHCDDWAAASILEAEPSVAGDINGIEFNVGDKKGLLTLFTASNYTTVRYGNRYVNTNSDIDDIYPGGVNGFHQTLINYIGTQGLPIVLDIDPGEAIWSYPAYKYSMEWGDIGTVRHVTCTVWMADDFVSPDYVGTQAFTETYTYALEIDSQGNLLDEPGYWEGDSIDNHPDFMWFPTSSGSTHPYLDRGILDQIIGCEASGSDDRFEENDTQDDAFAITELVEDRFYWGSGWDEDWYRVAAEAGDDFYAFILSPSDDIDITIFDSLGNEMGYSFYHGAKMNNVAESAAYYIRVRNPMQDGTYYNIEFFSSPNDVIPHVTTINGWDTEMTMVGEEWYFDKTRINLFDTEKSILEQQQIAVPENQISKTSFKEMFSSLADEAATAKLLNLDAGQSPLGFFSYANDQQLVNIPFGISADNYLLLPQIRDTGSWGTGIALENMNVLETANIAMLCYSAQGQQLSGTSFQLGPGMNRTGFVSSFGNIPSDTSWVAFSGDQKMQGIVLWATSSGKSSAGLAGIPLLREENLSKTLFIPHVPAVTTWQLEITIVNPNTSSTAIDITGYDRNGDAYASKSLTLSAKGSWSGTIQTLWGGSWNEKISWVKIDSSQKIAGYQIFLRGVDSLGALPLMTESDATDTLHVKYIPTAGSCWTGLVLLNFEDEKTDVWAEPLDADGNNLLGDKYLWYNPPDGIGSKSNAVGVLENLFPGFPEGTVRLKVYSEQPIIGFGLYEKSDTGQFDVLYIN